MTALYGLTSLIDSSVEGSTQSECPENPQPFSGANEGIDQCQLNETPLADCIPTQIDNILAVL